MAQVLHQGHEKIVLQLSQALRYEEGWGEGDMKGDGREGKDKELI